MASKPDAETRRKRSTGRKKIEIKKVEKTRNRQVTFSKRKLGLFTKVTELSILSQAETALIVVSPKSKLYACGNPDPNAVIWRYLSGGSSDQKPVQEYSVEHEILRLQYEAARNRLKEEKKHLVMITEAHGYGCRGALWWNQSLEEMGLEDLDQFKASMERLMQNLVAKVEVRMNSQPLLPRSLAPPMPKFSYLSLFNGCVLDREDQAWNSNGSSCNSSSMVPYNGAFWPSLIKASLGHN